MSRSTNRPVQRVRATIAASQTDSVLVPAVAGKVIRVVSAEFNVTTANTACALRSKPGGAGSDLFTGIALGANTKTRRSGVVSTTVGEGLAISTGTGGAVTANIGYIVV